ncbi:hypothetical protein EV122DRAFT_276779 [Schizophyllum commune]
MSDQAVQYTPLGAKVSHAEALKETPRHGGTLFTFTHRTRHTQISEQQLAHIRLARSRRQPYSITEEQQKRLSDALIATAKKIPRAKNIEASQLQANVCELVFSGFSHLTCWTFLAVLALVTGRSIEQIKVWFSNNRQKRTKKGMLRVIRKVLLLYRKPLGVYPDKARAVQDMSLERFVQLIEAERARQTILLGRAGFDKDNVALQEKAGTVPKDSA